VEIMSPSRKILITGGAGSCGSHWTSALLEKGYEITVMDRDVASLQSIDNDRLSLVEAGVEDRDAVKAAVQGMDAVLHLAWSFSGDTLEVFEHDLIGHIYLLEEMAAQKVKHLIYTSTAVVYGKPRYSPLDEEHPLVVEEARKPLYGIAKAAAEKLCLMYWSQRELPATVIRFWWAYGDDIAGRHLREMLRTAASGEPLEVPAGSGGSFVHMDDLYQGMELCLFNPRAYGKTFNFSTVYVTWEEVAGMVRDVTGSTSQIRNIPKAEWKGSAFLADPWELSDNLGRELLGYQPMQAAEAKAFLKEAISNRWQGMEKSQAH